MECNHLQVRLYMHKYYLSLRIWIMIFFFNDYPQCVQLQRTSQLRGLTSTGEPKNK